MIAEVPGSGQERRGGASADGPRGHVYLLGRALSPGSAWLCFGPQMVMFEKLAVHPDPATCAQPKGLIF